MMLWQFGACIEGWNRVQGGGEKPPQISDEEYDRVARKFGYG